TATTGVTAGVSASIHTSNGATVARVSALSVAPVHAEPICAYGATVALYVVPRSSGSPVPMGAVTQGETQPVPSVVNPFRTVSGDVIAPAAPSPPSCQAPNVTAPERVAPDRALRFATWS